ncbi:PREDICTED: transmembrane protein 8B-like isoform X2 [Dinoponera quadriceps]|uniref:Transmembrane protein 8B-like isoform X2 n=1 Tax=Dinoponera quadriceps TaxID=609295 RepID=A0A6P3X6R2_DINQU|nr:PREDICTED: transmembrane protein 8B-like isoform X2 [Dinoponera quadriceps]
MRESILVILLTWTFMVHQGLCGRLKKIAQQPSNLLEDYSSYRHISIIHFNVPEHLVAVTFKFTAEEEKTGGIGKCLPRNVSLHLKTGSLPFVRPDGSKVAANLMKRRQRHYSLQMQSNGDEYTIKVEAPPAGDWYTIAFRSWTDPNDEQIKQQGLGASCETVLDSEMFVEMPAMTLLVNPGIEHEVQLNETSDSAIMQFLVPDVGFVEPSLLLNSSCGRYSNITSGGACERVHNVTTADVYVNSTGPAYVHVPFPEAGIWYVSMRAYCLEETTSDNDICHCGQTCLGGDAACDTCDCLSRCPVSVESIVASSPCIEGRCNDHGKCMHCMSSGFVFSTCLCTGGYRGFDCADDAYVLTHGGIILHLLTLTFSNLAFLGSIYVAIRREYFTEALSYAAVMFFSTFYHACEAGEDVYGVCIMRLSVLQFCDFFNALLAIWVTLVAMASLGPRLTAFCQIAGAIVLAMGAEMDRTALWVFLLPAVTGSAIIGLFWGYRCRRRQTIRYPSRPYRTIYFPAGLLLVALGLVSYAFLQTRKNYYLVHSLWHVCVAIGVILLLPKRQYMK